MQNKELNPNEVELISFVEKLKLQWMGLIDAIVDPIMIVDNDYKITKANKSMAQFSGSASVKDIIGQKCHKVLAKKDDVCGGCKMKDSLKTGSSISYELEDLVPGKYFEVSSQPLMNEKGQHEGVVQIYRDRTEAKSLHDQLIQSEKLASIGLLAGGIAHEINNPLGGILIFSQMLLKEMDKESPHYPDVVEIEAATQRCKEIVESLLDFARQQPGEVSKQIKPISVKEIVGTAMRFANVSGNAKKCEVFYDWQDENCETTGDRNRYIQVFLNLFQNAFQAMPEGGTITLVQRDIKKEDEQFINIEIRDSGLGIPEENLDQIFDPFFTTKDPGEGTGLGLAICYGIIKEIGGDLSVKSTVNEGTSFFLKLPKCIQID